MKLKSSVTGFKKQKRKNHHIESLLQKESIKNFHNKNYNYIFKSKKPFIIADLTGFAVGDNYNEYLERLSKNIELYCVERNKKLIPKMYNNKNNHHAKNAHIVNDDFFNFIFNSGIKFNHLNFDATATLQTLKKEKLYKNIDKLFSSKCVYSTFSLEILYEIGQTTHYYKKDIEEIQTKLYFDIKKIAKKHGYITKRLHCESFCDYKRPMQPILIGFQQG